MLDTLGIKTRKRTNNANFIGNEENSYASEAKSRKAAIQNEDLINEREYHLSSDNGEQLEKDISSIQENNSNTVEDGCLLDDTNNDPYTARK